MNDFGVSVGFSQNGELDPLTGNPELKAALWKDGHVIDLGTLGGNGASANAINDRGQIFGGALNTIPDPDSSFPVLCSWGYSGACGSLGARKRYSISARLVARTVSCTRATSQARQWEFHLLTT